MSNDITKNVADIQGFKGQLAEAAGYTGPDAETFISAIKGETPEEMVQSAKKIVDFAESLKPKVRATDPSQGRGGGAQVPTVQKRFVKMMDQLAEDRATGRSGGMSRGFSL